MSTFTIRLSEIEDMGEPIFATDDPEAYPIFSETHRPVLNRKILDHYANYEIGHETISMFRFALNRKMREIMPYYNQLYKSTLLEIDPLATVNYTEAGTSENEGTASSTSDGTNESTTNSKSRSVSSDTPQTHLQGNEDYATGATDSIGESTVNGSSEGTASQTTNANGSVNRNVTGSQGHQATLLMQYRKSLLNIDMNVISELESLFMAVWDNGDEFSGSRGISYGWTYGGFGYI